MRPTLQSTKLAQASRQALQRGDYEAAGELFALARIAPPTRRGLHAVMKRPRPKTALSPAQVREACLASFLPRSALPAWQWPRGSAEMNCAIQGAYADLELRVMAQMAQGGCVTLPIDADTQTITVEQLATLKE